MRLKCKIFCFDTSSILNIIIGFSFLPFFICFRLLFLAAHKDKFLYFCCSGVENGSFELQCNSSNFAFVSVALASFSLLLLSLHRYLSIRSLSPSLSLPAPFYVFHYNQLTLAKIASLSRICPSSVTLTANYYFQLRINICVC